MNRSLISKILDQIENRSSIVGNNSELNRVFPGFSTKYLTLKLRRKSRKILHFPPFLTQKSNFCLKNWKQCSRCQKKYPTLRIKNAPRPNLNPTRTRFLSRLLTRRVISPMAAPEDNCSAFAAVSFQLDASASCRSMAFHLQD